MCERYELQQSSSSAPPYTHTRERMCSAHRRILYIYIYGLYTYIGRANEWANADRECQRSAMTQVRVDLLLAGACYVLHRVPHSFVCTKHAHYFANIQKCGYV